MATERHTLTALVDNEAGVLARVVGLFSGRGYNIESLTVAEVDPKARTSRITIVTSGPPAVIEQIEAQLRRVVPVHAVTNWTFASDGIEREMALVKVSRGALKAANEAAEKFGARVLDEGVFELTDAPAKISSFIETMRALGLTDVSRTGVAAISRDSE
ncbi:MAG TPA: acetolactate synthase small subunit [Rhizomicrobium sp.]|nr:acetolactate synthase small subunit [Rhizomicrobium sp.]